MSVDQRAPHAENRVNPFVVMSHFLQVHFATGRAVAETVTICSASVLQIGLL